MEGDSRTVGQDESWRREFEADLDSREAIDREVEAFIRSLRPRYRTAYLSNAWPGTRARLEERGVLDAVDEVVISAEVGVAKPDEGIFRIALVRLDVEPDETLFVDDSERNVETARALGMHAVHYRSPEGMAEVRALLD